MRQLSRFAVLLLIALVMTACDTSTPEPPPPTLASMPTPTSTHTQTPTPAASPTLTVTPSPTAIMPQSVANNPADQAYIRVVHAAPDTPTIDVYIERLAVASNLNFTTVTGQVGIAAGNYKMRVVPSGNRLDDDLLLESELSLLGGQSLVLLVTGTPDALTFSTIIEPDEPLLIGESRITFVHAVPRGPDFMVQQGNNTLTRTLSFGEASDSIVLPSGNTALTFQSGSTVLSAAQHELRDRYNHIFMLAGRSDDPDSLSVISFDAPAPMLAAIRVINTSASIGSIDIYLDDNLLADNIAFGRSSPREYVAVAIYSMHVYPTGADPSTTTSLFSTSIRANPDDTLSMIVTGTESDLRIIRHLDDLSPTPPEEARIIFANTLANVPLAQVETVGGPIPGISNLRYGEISEVALLQGGSLNFYWNTVENNVPSGLLEIADNVTLEPGRSYLYLLTGNMDNSPAIFSDNVGVDRQLAFGEPTLTPTPRIPTKIRMVNAYHDERPVAFYMDDIPLSDLAYSEGAEDLLVIPEGEHIITAELTEVEGFRVQTVFEFEPASTYSIFAYGSIETEIELLIVDDFNLVFDMQSAHMRLINLTQRGEALLGLAYSVATSDITQPSPDDNYRQSIPIGITRFIDDVPQDGFSIPARPPMGEYNIRIVDSARNSIAMTLTNILLEVGEHYDVVAFQHPRSMQMIAFVVPYSER